MLSQCTCSMFCFQKDPVDSTLRALPHHTPKTFCGLCPAGWLPSLALNPLYSPPSHLDLLCLLSAFGYWVKWPVLWGFTPVISSTEGACGFSPPLFSLRSGRRETTLDMSLGQKLQVVTLKLTQQRTHLFLEANSVVRWSEEPDGCRTWDGMLVSPGYSRKAGGADSSLLYSCVSRAHYTVYVNWKLWNDPVFMELRYQCKFKSVFCPGFYLEANYKCSVCVCVCSQRTTFTFGLLVLWENSQLLPNLNNQNT